MVYELHLNKTVFLKMTSRRTSLVIQWLRYCASTAEGMGSVPGLGAKIPQALQHGKKKKDDLEARRKLQTNSVN